jgi:hypothetical protein
MRSLKFLLFSICLLFTTLTVAQGPDIPPDDGSGQELDIPLSGSETFLIIALGLGGFLIYKRNNTPRKNIKKSEITKISI